MRPVQLPKPDISGPSRPLGNHSGMVFIWETPNGHCPWTDGPLGNSSASVGICISLKENVGDILKYHVHSFTILQVGRY